MSNFNSAALAQGRKEATGREGREGREGGREGGRLRKGKEERKEKKKITKMNSLHWTGKMTVQNLVFGISISTYFAYW